MNEAARLRVLRSLHALDSGPDRRFDRIARMAAMILRAPRRVIGVVRDVTERKAEEEHRETLLAELEHRVKNVLAAVQSLAAQSARRTTSTEGFLAAFAGRLKAMASAHELLTATRWRGASLAHIAAAELGGLVTNAVKYGALSVDAGRVEVTWERSADGGFTLCWVEHGGPPVSSPERRGFGSALLDQVTGRELGGECRVDYRTEGVRVVLRAAPRAIADPVEATPVIDAEPAPGMGASQGLPEGTHGGVEGLRLLVVEDAVLLAMELEAGLVEAGAIVVGRAAELGEAMAMLGLQIDAAVLDANLNGESVEPLAAALHARGTPFVFATGYGERAAPEGYDAPIVRKPYNVHQIVRALAEATGR